MKEEKDIKKSIEEKLKIHDAEEKDIIEKLNNIENIIHTAKNEYEKLKQTLILIRGKKQARTEDLKELES